ncbi:peptidase inhibitor family I36 protein [Streptomyces sp. NRRL S-350]|uniref:peptidase inhibitor family I36 protein n=1 Tax=Streptomyces sp. NRRL S-350 TaxID=1463902 RepID=UPI000D140EA5|nr:peptidase inhibitor family I36 protein [Streptomyces sp. NRRL S-350]
MRIRMGRHAAAKAAAVAALTAGAMGLATGNAFAAGPGGAEACPSGNVCLYYNSPGYNWGSWEDWSPNQIVYLGGATFSHWGNGSGYGQVVLGNAASIVNNTGHTVWVTDDNNHKYDYLNGYAGSLNSTANHDVWLQS